MGNSQAQYANLLSELIITLSEHALQPITATTRSCCQHGLLQAANLLYKYSSRQPNTMDLPLVSYMLQMLWYRNAATCRSERLGQPG
jgi:hypothetical protein